MNTQHTRRGIVCVYKDYAVHEAKTNTNDGRYILHEFMRCIECVLASVCLYEYAFRDNASVVDTRLLLF